jgi:hypothetical protein
MSDSFSIASEAQAYAGHREFRRGGEALKDCFGAFAEVRGNLHLLDNGLLSAPVGRTWLQRNVQAALAREQI